MNNCVCENVSLHFCKYIILVNKNNKVTSCL